MRTEQPKVARSNQPVGNLIRRYGGEAVVIALALLLWLPRFSGPIDLRWDGGVYYLLGTSLAEGHGYRIPSEPGSPEALQYPPLLPVIVAAHQLLLGTSDWHVVAPWLRKSYAVIFLGYALAVIALARRHLGPGFATVAAALCLLQVTTIFLSDVLFTELPFALVSVLFVLVAGYDESPSRLWLREAASFALAAAGFLLRSIGVALLGAWVLEACARKRWWLALARATLALIPAVTWYGYGMRVRSSYDYRHPAYEYERAPYLFYNVSYAENALLIDPFRPDRGRINAQAFVTRLAANTPSMVLAVGETVSTVKYYWKQALEHLQRRLVGRVLVSDRVILAPILLLSIVVTTGLLILARRRAFLMTLIVVVSSMLICTTPWPLQFQRYLTPLAPFLAIAAVLAITRLRTRLGALRPRQSIALIQRLVLPVFMLFTLGPQAYAACQIFYHRHCDGASFMPADAARAPHFFFHDKDWVAWERAIAWIDQHAPVHAIVATPSSHLCYLLTGRRAVSPPIEPDPARARRLLESVPVSYVIVDQLGFIDVSRRYARPAVQNDPGWRLVLSVSTGTKVYERNATVPESP